jgi:hypothetical protein
MTPECIVCGKRCFKGILPGGYCSKRCEDWDSGECELPPSPSGVETKGEDEP